MSVTLNLSDEEARVLKDVLTGQAANWYANGWDEDAQRIESIEEKLEVHS